MSHHKIFPTHILNEYINKYNFQYLKFKILKFYSMKFVKNYLKLVFNE